MVTRQTNDNRAQLIATAIQQFSEKGFNASNINDIAIMAGLGKGTVYLYFKSKKDLYLSTIQTIVNVFNEATENLMKQPMTNRARLEFAVSLFFELERDELPFLKLWARHQFHSDPTFPEEVSEIFRGLRQPLCEIIELGVQHGEFSTKHPKVTAYMLLSLLVMLIPDLQSGSIPMLIEGKDRIDFVIDVAMRVLRE